MLGPRPPDTFVSNGVTCGPDVLGTADLRPAAHFHDFAYSIGGTEVDRYRDDWRFNANLKTCGLTGIVRGAIRLCMYYRLRAWGHFHYTYRLGHEPDRWSVKFWWHLLIGRYVEW
jgi:hypothetical protein